MGGDRAKILSAAMLVIGCSGNSHAPAQDRDIANVLEDVQVTADPITTNFALISANQAAASCPDGDAFVPPQQLRLDATPLDLGTETAVDTALASAVTYVGGWHLTTNEPNFGGLSGLDILEDGNLLAVSDAGAFIHIGMTQEAPNGDGAISYMLGADGKLLDGKRASDAEGLHVDFGLAAVSFERDHRIAVFNLDDCGALARGVPVSSRSQTTTNTAPETNGLPEDLPDNNGLEALTFIDGNFLSGIEASDRTGTPLYRPSLFGNQFSSAGSLNTPRGLKLTGLDSVGIDTYALFRRYLPIFGNTIEVRRYRTLDEEGTVLIRLERPLTVDNFEGIAAKQMPNGATRLFIISDDNFSGNQRTLLLAFEVLAQPDPN